MAVTCTSESLANASVCQFACIPPGILGVIKIRLLCAILNGETMACDATTLIEAAKCLECQIPPGMLGAIEVYLLCQIANSGAGGGGGASVTCGAIDPVAAPVGSCSVYYETAAGVTPSSIWIWDSGLAAWVKVLA